MTLIRLATFNVLHGRSLTSEAGAEFQPESAAEGALRDAVRELDADVLALQEVDRGQHRSAGVDQAAVVADELGAEHWRFEPSLHAVPGPYGWRPVDGTPLDGGAPAYGIALVSRFTVTRWAVRRFAASPVPIPLKVPGRRGLIPIRDEPRIALAAVVDVGRPLTAISTHLSFVPGWNVAQVRRIARWADAEGLPEPRVLLGDLNLPGAIASAASGWTRLVTGPTYPSWAPRVQFDHILGHGVRPTAVRSSRVQRLGVSDHCAVVVDVDV